MMRELKDLFKTTGGGSKFIFLLLLRCPFNAIQTLIQATFLQSCFIAIGRRNINELNWACGIFGVGSLLLFLYNGTVWMIYAGFNIHMVGTLRKKLYRHISGISLQQIEEKPSGEWLTRLNSDVQQATAIFNQPFNIPFAAVAIVSICVSSAILYSMNFSIFALVILFLVPHLLISQLYIAKPVTSLAKKAQEATAGCATSMNTITTCADTAILYDADAFLLKQFEKSSLELRRVNMKIRHRNACGSALTSIMGMSGYLMILLVGGIWISAGHMTFGDLTAAFQYRGGVIMGAMLLTNSLISIKVTLAGVRRVNETMHIQSEEK